MKKKLFKIHRKNREHSDAVADQIAAFKHLKKISLSSSEKGRVSRNLSQMIAKDAIYIPPVQEFQVSPYHPFSFSLTSRIAISVAAIAFFITASFGGVMYASADALPGDILYPVKINVKEKLEFAFAKGEVNKAQVASNHAEVRLKEAAILVERGNFDNSKSDILLKNVEENIRKVEDQVALLEKNGQTEQSIALKNIIKDRGVEGQKLLRHLEKTKEESRGVSDEKSDKDKKKSTELNVPSKHASSIMHATVTEPLATETPAVVPSKQNSKDLNNGREENHFQIQIDANKNDDTSTDMTEGVDGKEKDEKNQPNGENNKNENVKNFVNRIKKIETHW
jgi:hypothetical protein